MLRINITCDFNNFANSISAIAMVQASRCTVIVIRRIHCYETDKRTVIASPIFTRCMLPSSKSNKATI